LGIKITKKFVEKLGGKISVESKMDLTCPQKRDPIIKLGSKEKKLWAKTNSHRSRSLVNFGKLKFYRLVDKA
jgi:hypothetical protein